MKFRCFKANNFRMPAKCVCVWGGGGGRGGRSQLRSNKSYTVKRKSPPATTTLLKSGPVHPYLLEEPISNFRVFGGSYFLFLYYLHNLSGKQTEKTLIRRRILRRLTWVCTVAVVS